MNQRILRRESQRPKQNPSRSTAAALAPPLVAALLCTAMIIEAIATALTGRANGDLMVLVCPILGAIFLSIPAVQAWWACIKILRR
jgi:hypothetical protein